MKQILLLSLLSILSSSAFALNKAKLIEHIGEMYPMPPEVSIEIGDPRPSNFKDFHKIIVTFRGPAGEQTEQLYLSKDEKHYLLGDFKDLTIHPDTERLRKINLKNSAVRGDVKAPILVVEYTDFQCFYCRKGYQMMTEKIMKDYKGKVRWVYKSLPLVQIHPWAEPAAIAVECAGKQSSQKLWDLHDIFFEKQPEITTANFDENLPKFLKKANIDEKKFNACFDKKETLAAVTRDKREAGSMGISGTPAFIVNGHLISGADYQLLRRTIDESLQGKHGKI